MAIYGTISPSNQTGDKNLIINGGFDHWQRSTSATGTSGYLAADRWAFSNNLSAAVSRQAFAPGSLEPGTNSRYFLRLAPNGNTHSAGFISLRQFVEFADSVPSTAPFTVSFWFRSSSITSISLTAFALYNSTTSYESIGSQTSAAIPLNTWTKVSFTFTQVNLTGKTFTADNNSIMLQFQNGSTFSGSNTWDMAEVQMEVGSLATNFQRRHPATELALCQRYYTDCGVFFVQGYGYGVGSDGTGSAMMFPTTMRITPTMTQSAGNDGGSAATMTLNYVSTRGCSPEASTTNGSTSQWYYASVVADAELT